jgi:hypothetical protein
VVLLALDAQGLVGMQIEACMAHAVADGVGASRRRRVRWTLVLALDIAVGVRLTDLALVLGAPYRAQHDESHDSEQPSNVHAHVVSNIQVLY